MIFYPVNLYDMKNIHAILYAEYPYLFYVLSLPIYSLAVTAQRRTFQKQEPFAVRLKLSVAHW